MAEFNYTEYLRNNPLLKKEEKTSLNENQRPGYHPDGTPKSNAEMTDDEREEFYLNLDDVSEAKPSSKMKVSELKAKIKEDIIATLSEQEEIEEEVDLESQLMADLDENIDEAKKDEAEEEDFEEEDVDVEVEDEADFKEPEVDTSAPSVGLSPEEQEIQNSLKVAYDNAMAMGDEKLANQIGNSITFFTRSHVVER